MYRFGKTSESRLITCHPDIQTVMRTVINDFDFTVVCGHRGREAQEEAFQQGKSHLHFPQSKHNVLPSLAIDIAPFRAGKIDWENTDAFTELANRVLDVARTQGIPLAWGGHWKTLVDMPHFELP